jgi:hypothetical protein
VGSPREIGSTVAPDGRIPVRSGVPASEAEDRPDVLSRQDQSGVAPAPAGDPLARVSAFEGAHLPELTWATLRCPGGLDEVAEPHTAARHRAVIDTGAGRTPRPAG